MTPDELIKFTGATGPNVQAQAQQALSMAEAFVDAYCRGRHKRGGVLRPGVDAVITAVAARILANPEQIQQREQVGPYSFYRDAGFQGFNLVELAVLNRYRKRAK
ncbi:hypothetical protein [Corynebacterium epidermidicanis]|uniref:Uncharacterized protein n=1 Tax=Corynebacterium epidermidicanis TaxID=1050174 RepID=A0A0G3GS18_9CORY|nr:hypothetical protein [Corynebacterium epidermidicanis]AKK02338.1 hypothetical protein CEPID_02285 [Corynebacterium epidermidicanis]